MFVMIVAIFIVRVSCKGCALCNAMKLILAFQWYYYEKKSEPPKNQLISKIEF